MKIDSLYWAKKAGWFFAHRGDAMRRAKKATDAQTRKVWADMARRSNQSGVMYLQFARKAQRQEADLIRLLTEEQFHAV